jgi:hypothetical protein
MARWNGLRRKSGVGGQAGLRIHQHWRRSVKPVTCIPISMPIIREVLFLLELPHFCTNQNVDFFDFERDAISNKKAAGEFSGGFFVTAD